MNSQDIFEYIHYLEDTISELKAKNINEPTITLQRSDFNEMTGMVGVDYCASEKYSKWYEREPFKKTICWVSDESKNPKEEGIMEIITDYHKGFSYPFCSEGGQGWKYTIPLTNEELEELLIYIIEEQENEQ